MISVIVASYNGQDVLPLTLGAFTNLIIPEQGVEFIIVDNASTDQTASIIKQYANKLPLIYVREDQQGKAFAIHSGIAQASGDFIVLTDDDVVPHPNWLQEYAAIAKNKPEHSLFFGEIRPYWLKPPPKWLIQLTEQGRSCGCTPVNLPDGEASFHLAKGANLAMRKELLENISFREDLWIAGKNAVGGEDTDFAKKACDLGSPPWFSKKLTLQHIVRPHEMTMFSVYQRYYRIGRSMAAVTPETVKNNNLWFGYPKWILADIGNRSLTVIRDLIMFRRFQAMSELINIAVTCGKAKQNKNTLE